MESMAAGDSRPLCWGYLGNVPYDRATDLQVELREALRAGSEPEHLLLLEHPPVYTLGRNASRSDVVAAAPWLEARGVEVVETDRGGRVTFHGPGQLVGYPILDLSPDRRDIRRYVRDLQEVLVRTLTRFGVGARGGTGPERIGVWVGERKIASLGVHISRWLTTHGFALNVSTDLSFFAGIVPCGLRGVEMTSIERETGTAPPLEEVAESCAREFAEVFGRRRIPMAAARCPTV